MRMGKSRDGISDYLREEAWREQPQPDLAASEPTGETFRRMTTVKPGDWAAIIGFAVSMSLPFALVAWLLA